MEICHKNDEVASTTSHLLGNYKNAPNKGKMVKSYGLIFNI